MGIFILKAAEHFGVKRMHAIGPDVGTPALLFAAARRPTVFESLISSGKTHRRSTRPISFLGLRVDIGLYDPRYFWRSAARRRDNRAQSARAVRKIEQ
jgi:hypothetical protein